MPEFVIERDIPGAGDLTEAQLREVSQKSVSVLKEMGPQIRWLHSYVTGNKVYCVYFAPDEATILEHARRVGLPANRVSAVRRLSIPHLRDRDQHGLSPAADGRASSIPAANLLARHSPQYPDLFTPDPAASQRLSLPAWPSPLTMPWRRRFRTVPRAPARLLLRVWTLPRV